MSQSLKHHYRTTNWRQYKAALKNREVLTVWLDKRICWFVDASGKTDTVLSFQMPLSIFLTLKNLFGFEAVHWAC